MDNVTSNYLCDVSIFFFFWVKKKLKYLFRFESSQPIKVNREKIFKPKTVTQIGDGNYFAKIKINIKIEY